MACLDLCFPSESSGTLQHPKAFQGHREGGNLKPQRNDTGKKKVSFFLFFSFRYKQMKGTLCLQIGLNHGLWICVQRWNSSGC